MFTLNSLLLIFDVILHRIFVQRWSWFWGGERKGSTYFAKRYICSTFYTHKYKESFFYGFQVLVGRWICKIRVEFYMKVLYQPKTTMVLKMPMIYKIVAILVS